MSHSECYIALAFSPQNAFVQLSLAFRNDNYTLETRMKQAERERNLTEEDTEKELEEFKRAMKVSPWKTTADIKTTRHKVLLLLRFTIVHCFPGSKCLSCLSTDVQSQVWERQSCFPERAVTNLCCCVSCRWLRRSGRTWSSVKLISGW